MLQLWCIGSRFLRHFQANVRAFLISKDSYPFWILVLFFVHLCFILPVSRLVSTIHLQQHRRRYKQRLYGYKKPKIQKRVNYP